MLVDLKLKVNGNGKKIEIQQPCKRYVSKATLHSFPKRYVSVEWLMIDGFLAAKLSSTGRSLL